MVATRSTGTNNMSEHHNTRYSRRSTNSRRRGVVSYAEANDDSNDESDIISIRRRRRTRSSSKIAETEEPTSPAVNGNSDDDFPSKRYNGNSVPSGSPSRRLSTDYDHKYQQQSVRHPQLDADLSRKKQRGSMSHSRSLRSLGLEEEGSSCEDEDGIGALATSVRPRSSSRDGFPNMLLRRSSRKKNAIYSTLNVSTIEHAAMLPEEIEHVEHVTRQGTEKQHRIKSELRDLLLAQGKNPEDLTDFTQPDIYSSIKSRRSRRPKKFFDDEMKQDPQDNNQSDNSGDEQETEKRDKTEGEDEENEEEEEDEEEDEDDDDDDEDEEENVTRRKYSLRTKRAQPSRLAYEIQRPHRHTPREIFDHLPAAPVHRRRRRTRELATQHSASPYQRRQRRTNSQGASSSGTTESDDDEAKFERRKKKSMTKARNRCLPMNLTMNDLATHGLANERRKIGSSLADVDPMNVDKTVTFSAVGGHQKHVRSLKEMVVFPLMYPEVFEKFHIHPPRGCLFYGPPGTGKTLMARALANECSSEGRKVAFFMRKGADCLSKWVGESERQLRLLFDQAYQMRPSIIFFDEIDGLAPVRSSRQDQIHSSIVSTLLGLMDGLDNRGEIIVIGATNRIDSIDPALRRPGRFDREFLFPLPDKKARREILTIHTQKWIPPPSNSLVDDLAEKTVGYCGADIMALCAESALFALRRRYPQIYSSNEKLKLNVDSIDIKATDFFKAMKNVVPTAQRSDANPGRALHSSVRPLLHNTLRNAAVQLAKLFPLVYKKSKVLKHNETNTNNPTARENRSLTHMSDSESDIEDDTAQAILPLPINGLTIPQSLLSGLSSYAYRESTVHRPRLILCGDSGDGQTSHLAPALLHDIEGIPVHLLDIPALYGTSARTPEEACAQIFREARRTSPSIVYIPNVPMWWESASPTVLHTFASLLGTLPASAPVALIATADCLYNDLPFELSSLFSKHRKEVFAMRCPNDEERTLFFAPVFLHFTRHPPVNKLRRHIQSMEVLEKAPPPKAAELTEKELEKIELEEEATMRSLRLFLRDVLTRLAQDRRFKVFLKPVDIEEVTDYMEVIDTPMDISTMMNKIDQHKYSNVAFFVSDINLICSNALEYNPDVCAEDKAIRHRACLLRDIAHAIIQDELDPNFEKLCNEVTEARQRRNANPLKFAPAYFNVLPKARRPSQAQNIESGQHDHSRGIKRDEMASTRQHSHSAPRKKRRRSNWASGVIKKPKKKARMEDDSDDENEEEVTTEHGDGGHDSEDDASLSKSVAEEEDACQDKCEIEEEDACQDKREIEEEEERSNTSILGDTASEDYHESLKKEVRHRIGPAGDAGSRSDLQNSHRDFDDSDHFNNVFKVDEKVVTSEKEETCMSNLPNISENPENVNMENKSDFSDSEKVESLPLSTIVPETLESIDPERRLRDSCSSESPGRFSTMHEENKNMQQSDHDDEQTTFVEKEQIEKDEASPAKEDNLEKDSFTSQDDRHKEPPTICRMTLRSRKHSNKQEPPPLPPPSPPPPLIVDEHKLKDLLHFTVQATASFHVEALERLYSVLTRCVHKHRNSYDKTELIQELTFEVTSFVGHATEAEDKMA